MFHNFTQPFNRYLTKPPRYALLQHLHFSNSSFDNFPSSKTKTASHMLFPHPFSPSSMAILVLAFLGTIIPASSLQFSFPPSKNENSKFVFIGYSYPTISWRALDISLESSQSHQQNKVLHLHQQPFKLHCRKKLTETWTVASFNTTFVFNIPKDQAFAFILTSHPMESSNSHEVLVQFSNIAKRRNGEVVYGLDVNIRNSITGEALSLLQLDLSSGVDVRATIRYDGKSKDLTVDVSALNFSNKSSSNHLDLSKLLLDRVYVGFSTSSNKSVEIKSWEFSSKDSVRKHWVGRLFIRLCIVSIIILLIAVLVRWVMMRSRHKSMGLDLESVLVDSTIGPHKFRLKQLRTATENFDPKNKLGQGGFGIVYRGSMGKEVAVKRVSKYSLQVRRQFLAEVNVFSRIRHKNLVKLFGWCYEEDELLLVYELLPKGSLDKLIFSKDEIVLSWERRHSILTGVASALCYLHDGCEMKVLHRDVKASNVMIDSEFNARLGDFGLARTVQRNGETHHSTDAIAGTPGYIAPEYYLTGRASVETDVYGFGVLVLEVACGRRTSDILQSHSSSSSSSFSFCSNIVDWVWELYEMGRPFDAVDRRLHGDYDGEKMEDVLRLGLACCHPNPHERPSMNVALQVLRGEVASPVPPCEKPSFIWPAITTFSGVVDFLHSDLD